MSQETIAQSPEITKKKSSILPAQLRKTVALESLSKKTTVKEIAQTHGISRKSVHAQKNKALSVIDEAFQIDQAEAKEKVLFTINVTKSWLRQFIVCLVLCCHSSFRGIIDVFSTLIGRVSRRDFTSSFSQTPYVNLSIHTAPANHHYKSLDSTATKILKVPLVSD